MLMRYGGGKASRLSIPRDTLVNIPGFGPNKINAAYAFGGPALMIQTVKEYLGIEINHIVEVDFEGFPKFVDAMGGVKMTFGKCIVSRFEGRTVRFRKGEHKLDGQEALDVVRIRKNRCAPEESDLTRARRQQQFLEAVKGRIFSPFTFPRWPWAAWRAPKAIAVGHGRHPADGALRRHRDRRRHQAAHPAADQPRREPAGGLTAREAGRGAAVPGRVSPRGASRSSSSSPLEESPAALAALGLAVETPSWPAFSFSACESESESALRVVASRPAAAALRP